MWLGWLDGAADGMRCGRARGRGAPREHKVLARGARRDAVEDGGALEGAAVDGGGRAHVHERQGRLGGAVLAHRGGAPRPRGVIRVEAGPAGAAAVHPDHHRHLHPAPRSSCPVSYLDDQYTPQRGAACRRGCWCGERSFILSNIMPQEVGFCGCVNGCRGRRLSCATTPEARRGAGTGRSTGSLP